MKTAVYILGIAILLCLASAPSYAYKDQRLVEAAGKGDAGEVQALLSAKADVNSTDGNGMTALMAAAEAGNAYIVNKLLAAGADVKVRDNQGKTAVKYAFENNHIHIGKLLLAAGARWESDALVNYTTSAAGSMSASGSTEGGAASGAGAQDRSYQSLPDSGANGPGARGDGACGSTADAGGGASYPQDGSYGGGDGYLNAGQAGGGQGAQAARMVGQARDDLEKLGKDALKVFFLASLLALLVASVYWTGLVPRLLDAFGRGDGTLGIKFAVKKAYNAGRLAERTERYADAVKHYEKALSLNSGHKDARFHLARVYHRNVGDPLSARKHYMWIVKKMSKRHAYYKEAMEAMRDMGVQADGQ